jgi:hypothetical protein
MINLPFVFVSALFNTFLYVKPSSPALPQGTFIRFYRMRYWLILVLKIKQDLNILAFGSLRQEDHEFKVSLDYLGRVYLKKKS